MERKILALVLTVMMVSIAAAGCLGGEEETGVGAETGSQLERKNGTIVEEAWVAGGPAAIEDVDVQTKVMFHVPEGRVISAKFSILIIDGHGDREHENTNTRPDELKGNKITGGTENSTGDHSKPIPMGGQTAVIDFRAPEGSYIPCTWEVDLVVTIKASDDQWPGPLIWRGYPDEGFYYIITLDYSFMGEV